MKIFYDLFEKHNSKKDGIMCIGYFDSFHLGHQKLLRELIEISGKNDLIPYVLTYVNLPQKNKNKVSVLDLTARLDFIKNTGIRNLILCEYNEKFYSILPDQFTRLLKNNFKINDYVVGKDFYFGKNKQGNVSTLKKLKCKTYIIEPLYYEDKKISTSLIRDSILKGDIELSNKLMGRFYSIDGIVHKGKQLGRTIGFPTMNIQNTNLINPKDGTYITKTHVKGKVYYSMTYVSDNMIETHLIGYSDYRYNLKIKIDFFMKIRDNELFSNIDNLKLQLVKDLEITRKFFKLK